MKRLVAAAFLSMSLLGMTAYGSEAAVVPNDTVLTGVGDLVGVNASTESAVSETAAADTAQETAADTGSETTMRSYLTGEVVDTEIGGKRPMAIMLNNISDALPQAGLANAAVVYEAPVEGMLTRLMGIFEDYNLDKIGSVRSCRDYFIDFAQEFDAIYVHYGQSVYAVSKLNAPGIDNISGLSYQEGIGEVDGYTGEDIFYRTDDRPAPHNCYTSYDELQTAMERLEYNPLHYVGFEGHYNFAADGQTVVPTTGTATRIAPGYPVNSPWFEYNADEGVYYRYQYGDAQIDQLTGEQVKYENVIFQVCECENYDENGYLNFNTKSGGDAYYFSQGAYQKCTWSVENPELYSSPARYYDENGNEITLNQGKTWVCIIRAQDTESISIE